MGRNFIFRTVHLLLRARSICSSTNLVVSLISYIVISTRSFQQIIPKVQEHLQRAVFVGESRVNVDKTLAVLWFIPQIRL